MGKTIRIFGVTLLIAATAVLYQNCGEGFEVNPEVTSLLSQAPDLRVISGPQVLTNSRTQTVEFRATTNRAKRISTISCSLNNAEWAACESPYELSDLADGAYALKIKAIDEYNYESEISVNFTVDATAPTLQVNAAPAAITGSADNQVSFTAADNLSGVLQTECSFQGADFAPCVSPQAYLAQAEEAYALRVRAKDLAGNISEVIQASWQVDLTAPVLSFVATPTAVTALNTASFQISATDNNQALTQFECQIDNGGFAACVSPVTFNNLTDGNHTFEFRATDLAGNLSSALAFSWMVDTVAPMVAIASGPQTLTNSSNATISFTATDLGSGIAALECRLDDGNFIACNSPIAYQNLLDGRHNAQFRARDAVGNMSPTVSYTWTIDTIVPSITITSGPSNSTNTTASFVFNIVEQGSGLVANSIACQLDGGAFAACSSPAMFTNLAVGRHLLGIRASDNAGNVGTASYEWQVTAVPVPVPVPVPTVVPVIPPLGNPNSLLFTSSDITLNSIGTRGYVVDRFLNALIHVNLINGERTIISSPDIGTGPNFNEPVAVVLINNDTQALVLDGNFEAGNLFHVDMATGNRTILASGFRSGQDLAINDNETLAYVVTTGPGQGGLYQVDLSTGLRLPVSSSSFILPYGLALNSGDTQAFVVYRESENLVSVDLATRVSTVISSSAVGAGPTFSNPTDIVVNANNTQAIVLNDRFGGLIYNVNLITGDRTQIVLSGVTPQRPRGLAVHFASNTAFLTDESLDQIIAIDLTTGIGRIVSNGNLGGGDRLVRPSYMALNANGTRSYISDQQTDAIYRVDLATGNRSLVSSAVAGVGNGDGFVSPAGIVVNNDETVAFVVDLVSDRLRSVNLVNGNRTVVSSVNVGAGPNFSSINSVDINANSDLAYVADAALDAIFRVDLVTGNRTIFSSPTVGGGPMFGQPIGIQLSSNDTLAFVLDFGDSALEIPTSIIRVDLATGIRTIVSANGVAGAGDDFPAQLRRISVNANGTLAYVSDAITDVIYQVDLSTGDRTIISSAVVGSGPRLFDATAVSLSPDGTQLYITDLGNALIMSLDLATGVRAVVSK